MFKKLSNIGDCGIVCDFGDEVSQKINTEVIKLFHYVRRQTSDRNLEGILNCTPSYNKLIINFDLKKINAIKILNFLKSIDFTKLNLSQKVVKNASLLGCPVLVHAEDYEECGCGIKKAREKNLDGLHAWSESRPSESEIKSIKTISKYARDSNCILYFAHIGSRRALEQISEERKNGTKIFVETCPHYLTLSHENQEGYLAKVMPPIRSESDVLSVWNAINQNHVNTIGTDHVANQIKLKLDGNTVWDALAGFPGIGTLLPLMLSEGVNKNKITISQLVNLTSMNAAKIFGMYPTKGSLELNSDADITLIDLKKEQKVTSDLFGGFSDYIVYDGWKLKGWPVKTIVRGQTIAEDFQVIGKPGYGKLVSRKTNST